MRGTKYFKSYMRGTKLFTSYMRGTKEFHSDKSQEGEEMNSPPKLEDKIIHLLYERTK
jgi:hypothetical protein